MSERCDLSDLLVDQCGCRLHRGGQTPQEEASEPGPWFTARFPGFCANCRFDYEAGARIRATGKGGWECCID